MAKIKAGTKGSCGGTPRNGKSGDPKLRGGRNKGGGRRGK